MHDWISRRAADLLAHKAGLLIFNVFTVAWFVLGFGIPETLGWQIAQFLLLWLAIYLDIVTWFGGATQFTLGYEARQAKVAALAAEEKTRQQDEKFEQMLVGIEATVTLVAQAVQNQVDLMRFLVDSQKEIADDVAKIEEAVDDLGLRPEEA